MDGNLDLARLVRTVPDFPKPGILFRDITTLLKDAAGFRAVVDRLASSYRGRRIDKVAGIESRGFIVGAALAVELRAGFVPIRKRGRLPAENFGQDYQLEYGADRLEMHKDGVTPGERVLVVDDLVATGGTALAALALVRRAGGEIAGAAFVIDLPDLGGRATVERQGVSTVALIAFPGH